MYNMEMMDNVIFTKSNFKYDNFTFGEKYEIIKVENVQFNDQTTHKLFICLIDDHNNKTWMNSTYFNDINIIRDFKLNRIIK